MASHFAPAIDVLDRAIRHSVHFREWLCARRWCGDAIGARAEVSVKERAVLAESGSEAIVLFLAVAKLPQGRALLQGRGPRVPPGRGARPRGGLVEPRRPVRDVERRGRVQELQDPGRAEPRARDPGAAPQEAVPPRAALPG